MIPTTCTNDRILHSLVDDHVVEVVESIPVLLSQLRLGQLCESRWRFNHNEVIDIYHMSLQTDLKPKQSDSQEH